MALMACCFDQPQIAEAIGRDLRFRHLCQDLPGFGLTPNHRAGTQEVVKR